MNILDLINKYEDAIRKHGFMQYLWDSGLRDRTKDELAEANINVLIAKTKLINGIYDESQKKKAKD